jgi:two-component system chemotaxis response regulator CheY
MYLSDMTGLQLAQTLRADERLAHTGFVLITAPADDPEVGALGKAANVVRLAKPFGLEQLRQAAAAAAAGSPPPTAAGTIDRLSRLRILLVDDSAAARAHMRGVLTGLGVRQIVEAPDGADAVGLLPKQTFDVVVTDYTMPRLDGRGLIDFIRHQSATPALPVIVVTTETDPAKLDAVRRLGVSAICDKKFSPDVARAILESL